MSRKLGDLGESVLEQWCAHTGILCNRAARDRGGWDFLLELEPAPVAANVPLDRRLGHRRCLVQVKATDSDRGTCAMKLSNWLRLVTSPLPAFVLVLEFGGEASPQQAYLIHVSETRMARVLRRLRELSAADPSVDLRSRRMALKWTEENQLSPANADVFVSTLESAIGKDPQLYSAEKRRLLDSLGYEESSGEIITRIKIPEGWKGSSWEELMADLQLGLVESLDTGGAELYDRRFEILSPEPIYVSGGPGKIEPRDRKPMTSVPLDLYASGRRVRLEVDIFAASLSKEPPKSIRDFKLRLALAFADIVISPAGPTGTIRWRWPYGDEPTSLASLVPTARLLSLAAEPTEAVGMSLFGSAWATLTLPRDAVPQPSVRMAKLLEWAWKIARAADVEDHVTVRLVDLWHQQRDFELCGHVVDQRPFEGTFSTTVDHGSAIPSGRCGVPCLFALRFSDELLWVPALLVGEGAATAVGESWEFRMEVDDSRVATPVLESFAGDSEVDQNDLLERAAELSGAEQIVRWWTED